MEYPILEEARRRLQAILDSSATDGVGLYLQQVTQAGLLVLDTLPAGLEAQQLAGIIAQQVDDVYNPLQNVTSVGEGLENDLIEFLGAITRIQEEILEGAAIEKLAAFEENLQEISARIAWRIVTSDDSELANATEEAIDDPSSHGELTSQTTNGNDSSMPNLLDLTNSPRGVNAPDGNTGDASSQPNTTDERMALRLQLEACSGTERAATGWSEQLPDSSTESIDSDPSDFDLGQMIDAEDTYQLGLDLLDLFQREGDLQNLSNSISLFREVRPLCFSGSQLRLMATGSLANALLTQHQQSGDHSDLVDAITLFYELLNLCPSGHPSRAAILGNFSSALLTRYRREGSQLDLSLAMEHCREALKLRPPGHPDRAMGLNNLSVALVTWYEREGSPQHLSEAIECHREALQHRPPDHPDRAMSLNNLSSVLLTRYRREGSLSDLSEAIECPREALRVCPPGNPHRALSLIVLSNAVMARYEHEGDLQDLSEATECYREALQLCPPGHLDRTMSLNNLSNALLTRYRREGALQYLSEATECHREALQLCPPGHPDLAMSLNNLSSVLLTRYRREGTLQDLSEAIECYQKALPLHPLGHPSRATGLNNLSNALLGRYQREGSLQDLSEAIECHREALQLYPPGHPHHATSLSNLSTALLIRYEREGSLQDLLEASECYREALQLCPSGHPDRAMCLNNLSNALLTRYQREGCLRDLSEATAYSREALQLRAPGHPDRAASLINMSNALLVRHKCEDGLQDLLEATECYREALQLHPPGHPYRASSLNNLSNTLVARYQHEGSLLNLLEATEHRRTALELRPRGHPERTNFLSALSRTLLHAIHRGTEPNDIHSNQTLIQEVFELLREAVDLPDCPPLHRLQAALQWIDTARQLASDAVLYAYNAALDLLDIVLATRDTLENKHTQLMSSEELSRCRRLGVEAASYALHQGRMELAVEMLERGRNLLFAQVGRYRVDLDDLREENPELAERFSNLSGLLDVSVVSNQSTLEGRTAFEDPIERYRRVSSAWNQTVEDIRATQGFEHFLRSPAFPTMQAAAGEGPVIIVVPGDDRSDALVITRASDKPHHVVLPKAGLIELQELYESLIQAVGSDEGATTEKSIKKILHLLWDSVVGPIADALQNKLRVPLHSRIWWCPTGLFSSLPLHAAGRYAPQNMDQNLPDLYVSSYTPTLQALRRGRRNRNISKGEKMLIVAQPDTPGQDELRNALPEAEGVKAIAEAKMKMKTTLLSSQEGTRDAVLNCMVNHSWIHLTCHGIQDPANPFDSHVCLYDGELTLQHIMRRGLPDAKFAFLAACHTATGDRELLDEGLHLAAGLQFAGFKSVVGTIWEIADIDGPVITQAFYEALRPERPDEGTDCSRAAHALSKAVKKLRDSGVPISRWMRFIHIGI